MHIRCDIRGGINIERHVSWVNACNQINSSSSGGGKEEEPEAGRCWGGAVGTPFSIPLHKTLQGSFCHLQNNVQTL